MEDVYGAGMGGVGGLDTYMNDDLFGMDAD